MEKVDVIVNVYGKPWQTLCSLKSLIKHSGEHIDKIYFIEERQQPYNDDVKWVLNEFDNVIHYIPNSYNFLPRMATGGDLSIKENRYGFRYQFGIENSDKKHVFIMHNDILFTGDIIGKMLVEIGNSAGIGSIAQCWNCPAKSAGVCNGEKFNDFNPTYEQVIDLCRKFPPARGNQFVSTINRLRPMPLPECRVNEFACLINREISIKESFPNGDSAFFGDYTTLDLATSWFRDLYLKGHKFKNYDISETSNHGYFANNAGYPTQLDQQKYIESEINAKNYYEEKLK